LEEPDASIADIQSAEEHPAQGRQHDWTCVLSRQGSLHGKLSQKRQK
jgi:hypothetical protein